MLPGWWMSKAQVNASGFPECSRCLTHGRTLKDCSEIGACRGPWGMGIGMQYDNRLPKHKAPRINSPGWYDVTPVALRFPYSPYRGQSVIDRLTNSTETFLPPPQAGAPPGGYYYDQVITQSNTQTTPGVYQNTQTNQGFYDGGGEETLDRPPRFMTKPPTWPPNLMYPGIDKPEITYPSNYMTNPRNPCRYKGGVMGPEGICIYPQDPSVFLVPRKHKLDVGFYDDGDGNGSPDDWPQWMKDLPEGTTVYPGEPGLPGGGGGGGGGPFPGAGGGGGGGGSGPGSGRGGAGGSTGGLPSRGSYAPGGTVYQSQRINFGSGQFPGRGGGFFTDFYNDGRTPAQQQHDYNQGLANHNSDDDSSDMPIETCECIANTGRYAGEHCHEKFYGKLCGFENCYCSGFKYTGDGCPGPYLGQPCDEKTINRDPYISDKSGCVCIDYTLHGANCKPRWLGQPCGRTFHKLDPDTSHDTSWFWGSPNRPTAI